MDNSTIAAIATPVASGGVGVLRISGSRSREILFHVFRRFSGQPLTPAPDGKSPLTPETIRSHHFYHGYIVERNRLIDEVLVVFMKAPRSYTGEDVVEVHAHSGPVVLQTILELLIRFGARLAEPGEFTRRAFLNGRMDLTQAEAVADIISAQSVQALHAATSQVAGRINREISSIIEPITGLLAEIEASIDFAEGNEVSFSPEPVIQLLRSAVTDPIQNMIDRYDRFAWIKKGPAVALAGIPNVGKSTLLNTLSGRERAIVSATPGTTRDYIEETIVLAGTSFIFTDTAGLRSATQDDVERTGMARTGDVLAESATIIFMVDAASGISREDYLVMATLDPDKMIIVANKTDLPLAQNFGFPVEWQRAFPCVEISALTGEGIDRLVSILVDRHQREQTKLDKDGWVPNLRHKLGLESALKSIASAIQAIEDGFTEEMIAIDLQEAIDQLNRITGYKGSTDVLDDIFSRFCIGK